MIFLLLELNYTTWFDHPGLLNLGHFWPQFFVERRIFRSQRSRRIIPHRVSHTTTTQGYYYKGQLTGWQFTHVTYGTRQLASCYFWNSHTHTLSCRVHASQVCFFPHFFSRVVGLKKSKKWTHAAGFVKKRKNIAWKFQSGLWEPSCLINFVQISTLTVVFFDWVSKSVIKVKCFMDCILRVEL